MSLKYPEQYLIKHPLGMNVFEFPLSGMRALCVASVDGEAWEHVSVTIRRRGKQPKRCPTWDEMCFVKNLFWEEEDEVIQFHPKKSNYANLHPFCLHLWRPVDGNLKLPKLN